MTADDRVVRVAVVGGGCAALTTAFELTRPEHEGRFEVTVYQMGWRLGGKGASGRGVADRIEEHGLHLWLGFYENAFRLMRECYEERRRILPNCRFADWRDAFKPAPDVGVADRAGDGWEFWLAHFPPGNGQPGDPITDRSPLTVLSYLRQSVILVGELLRSASALRSHEARPAASESPAPALGPETVVTAADALLRYGQLATTAALLEASDLLRQADRRASSPSSFATASATPLRLIEGLAEASRRQLAELVEEDGGAAARLAGDRPDPRHPPWGDSLQGLAIDPARLRRDQRLRLARMAATERRVRAVARIGVHARDLRSPFAFEDGDVSRPRLAAGVAMRGAMRDVLHVSRRAVLAHERRDGRRRLRAAVPGAETARRAIRVLPPAAKCELSPPAEGERPYVQSLEFDVQAHVKGGGEYQPLVDVKRRALLAFATRLRAARQRPRLRDEDLDFESHWDRRHVDKKMLRVGHGLRLRRARRRHRRDPLGLPGFDRARAAVARHGRPRQDRSHAGLSGLDDARTWPTLGWQHGRR